MPQLIEGGSRPVQIARLHGATRVVCNLEKFGGVKRESCPYMNTRPLLLTSCQEGRLGLDYRDLCYG